MSDPIASAYMTMSKLGALSSPKAEKHVYLMMKTIKGCVSIFYKGNLTYDDLHVCIVVKKRKKNKF